MKRYIFCIFILSILILIVFFNRSSISGDIEQLLSFSAEKKSISCRKTISPQVYYCSDEGGELREKPTLCSRLISNLEPGTPLIVNRDSNNGWINVSLADKSDGWINMKFLSDSPGKNYISLIGSREMERQISSRGSYVAASVVQTAYKCMGIPYVWGGSSPSGFDCSGFVQWVYLKNGVSISRTADIQYTEGVPVNDLEPGDLVFFTTYAPGASHVGLYLGCTLFIHASSSGSVRINSLDEDFYQSVFLGGRRYFN